MGKFFSRKKGQTGGGGGRGGLAKGHNFFLDPFPYPNISAKVKELEVSF